MNDFERNRQRLADIFQQTIGIVNEGCYITADDVTVTLGDDLEMRQNTRFYTHEFTVMDTPCKTDKTEITVVNNDSINAGLDIQRKGYNPIILNFANRRTAGGGVVSGCRAQEETIFRRSNLYRSLYQFMPDAEKYNVRKNWRQYPMDKDFGGIYTPYATVFRALDYSLLEKPEKISFVSVAAMNRPRLVDGEIAPELIEGTLNKMRTILRIGLYHGHDAIILGAFGCGAFQNPPKHIAQLFNQVIQEPEFKNKYKKIVFAIIEDHNSYGTINPDGNLQAFINVFKNASR